jgi:dephospho-CoA kinase
MTLIVGLTGGIGSGKSYVARIFQELGVPVYISDDRAKAIMNRKEVIVAVQGIFSENVIEDGVLDRGKIRDLVFKNKSLLEQLNSIIHPLVRKDFVDWVEEHKESPFVLKESAILFEKGLDKDCDYVILVTAPEELRIKRVMKRDNVSEKNIREIINVQMKDEEKIRKSDYVIVNSDDNFIKNDVLLVVKALNLKNNSI